VTKTRAAQQPEPAQAEQAEEPGGLRFWRYIGETARVYTHIPVTVEEGDIISWPETPATDGQWEQVDETGATVVKKPDNYRPDPEDHPTPHGAGELATAETEGETR